jgi:hypothetical protein
LKKGKYVMIMWVIAFHYTQRRWKVKVKKMFLNVIQNFSFVKEN